MLFNYAYINVLRFYLLVIIELGFVGKWFVWNVVHKNIFENYYSSNYLNQFINFLFKKMQKMI